jgi:hypothetical protein
LLAKGVGVGAFAPTAAAKGVLVWAWAEALMSARATAPTKRFCMAIPPQ